jgi:hypothetical protein
VAAFDADWQALIAKGEGSNYRVARRGSTDNIAYAGGVGEPAQAAPPVNDGEFHHVVAITRAGVQTELWIDGALWEVGVAPNIGDNDDIPLMIGANPDTSPLRYWNGVIDDVGIWARALEPAEVALIYNNGDGAPIMSLLDQTAPPLTSVGLNFGADEADGTMTGTLAADAVAGAPDVAQANWNNLGLFEGSSGALTNLDGSVFLLTAETASGPSPTSMSVEWASNNTWASTGRGEENNLMTGGDLALMTGYLDTDAETTTTVSISGIPGTFAQAGYDVYVYALGGVAGRGGAYRVLDASTLAPLTDYIQAQSPASPTEQGPLDFSASDWGQGTYMVFEQLAANNIVVEATTVDPYGFGGPNRAPINAVQIVPSPLGPPTIANVAWVSFHPADDTPSDAAAAAGFTEAPDVLYTTALRNAGYKVDRIVTSSTPDVALLNTYDLVIISRSVASSHYQDAGGTAWNSVTAPTILLGGYPMRSSRAGQVTGTTLADTIGTVSLTANDPSHPVFAGIPLDANNTMLNPYANIVTFNDGTQDLLQVGISTTMDPPAGNGRVLAVIATEGDPALGGMIIGEWSAGATMANAAADTLGGRRLSFLTGSRESGITSEGSGIFDLTGAGTTMFLNAVAYMTTPSSEIVIDSWTLEGNTLTATWTGGGEAEIAESIEGPWTPTGNSTGTITVDITAAPGGFLRIAGN